MNIKSCSRLAALIVAISLGALSVKASNYYTGNSGPVNPGPFYLIDHLSDDASDNVHSLDVLFTILEEPLDTCATIDGGADSVSICSSNIVGLQANFGGAATTASWSGGLGSFSPGTVIVNGQNIDYTPDPAEYGTTVTLYATTDDPGNGCGPAVDSIKIIVILDPVLSVSPVIVLNTCPATSVDLSSDVTVTDANNTTGTITYEDAAFNVLGSPVVSPPLMVPTIFYIRKTTAQGCDDFDAVTVFISACTGCTPPNLSGTTSNTSCPGGNDGSIDITVTGGTPPYTYQWSNGATTEDLTGLTAGTYTVTATDAQPCDTAMTFTVADGTGGVTANAGGDQSFCSFGINGLGTVGLSGAVSGGANATWVGGLGNFDPNRNDVNALYTPAISEYGSVVTLTLVAVDNSGTCQNDSDDVNLTVLLAPDVSGPTTASNICPATNLDLATLPFIDANSVTVAQFWFDIAGNQLTNTLVSPPIGVPTQYVIRSITATTPSCFDFDTVTVVINSCTACTAPIPSAIATNVSCNGGNDGVIDLSVTGGIPPYTFLWSNAATTEDISGLSAGTYTVMITDSVLCDTTLTVTITEPSALGVSCFISQGILCNGDATGFITANPSGGTPSYSFSWSNGSTFSALFGLTAGTYTVTVTDANGCTSTCSSTLVNPPLLTANCTATDVSCNGANDGSASVIASGGTGVYTYSWSNGQTSATAVNLSGGTYTVTVTDANNCTATCSATVNEPTVLTANCSSTPVLCLPGSDGTATVVAAGGTPGYSYLWSNAATTSSITGLVVGTYTVTVTDSLGCTDTCIAVVVGPPSPVSVNCTNDNNVSCNGANDGQATASASGGLGSYTYAWSTGSTNATINNLAPGVYTVTASDINNCTATCSITITEPSLLAASCNSTATLCNGDNNGTATISPSGGTSPYTYLWSNGQTSATSTGLISGTYTATVTDANSCTASCVAFVTSPPVLSANCTSTNVSCFGGADGSVTVSTSGGTPAYTVLWSDGQTSTSATNLTAGTYTVTVTDANGCTTTCSANVGQPAVLSLICSATDVSCNGGNNGSASVSVSGGNQPGLTYLWSDGQTTVSATGLTSGTYTVVVTDAKSCVDSCSILVNEPLPLSASCSATDATCNGGNDGSASVVPGGGTPGYTVLWSNGQTGTSATGLSAGTYTATVTDLNACTVTCSAIVGQASAVVAICSSTNVSCNGGSDGTASVIASGGTGPYTYAWNNGSTNSSISGLAPGNYSVTVLDTNGCIGTCNTSVGQPAPIFVFRNDSTCDPAQAGLDTTIYQTPAGCDSTVVTVFILYPTSPPTFVSASTCDPIQAGVDTTFLTNLFGCDSLIITTTTLDPSYIINFSASSCDPANVGVDTLFLTTGPGCDSLIITTTTLDPSYIINLSASSCDPANVGVDTMFFSTGPGCDSLIITTTTLDPSYIINLSASSCDPANVGVDTMFLSTGPGCDSLIITTTTLDPSYIINLSASSCDPAQVGVDTMFLSTGPGCDSLIITTTTLDPSYIINLIASSCDPAQVGVDTMFLSTGPGCDSLIITTTTLDPSYIINLSASSCDPAQVGVDTMFFSTGPGCDSLIITTTTLDPSYIINLSASSCDPAQVGVDTMFFSTGPGCDSLIITTTTLDPSYIINLSASSCDPAQVGVDTMFLSTGPGCDSLIITTTTLDPSYIINLSASSCDPAQVGVDTMFFSTGPGCDSLIITTTTLDPSYTFNVSASTCDPANVGVDTLFLTTGPGCDSLIITTTTLDPSYIINLSASSCDPAQVGIDTMFFSTGPGCDSLIITTTTLDPSYIINLSASSCDPAQVGVDTMFFSTGPGCDSLIITTTTLDPSYIINLSASTCDSLLAGVDTMFLSTGPGCDSLIITTTVYTGFDLINLSASTCDPLLAGIDTAFFMNQANCDSFVVTTTTLDPSYIINLSASSCDPANVGVDTLFLTTGPGCDSLIITTTTLDPSYTFNVSASSCDPANVGVDTLFLTTGPGCDSLIITTTTLDPSYIINLSASSCDPANVGVDTMFFSTGPGCDSLIITTTTLDPSYIINLSASSCDPANVGVDTMFLSTGPGCDSLIITTTTLDPSYIINLSASSCDPAQVGVDTMFLSTGPGCDSLIITTTTLDPSYIINLSASSCDPAQVGVDTMFLSTGPGCDSLIITTTTLDPSYTFNVSASSCDPANVGVDTLFLTTGPGCDSLIITTTTLDPSYIINLSASSCDPAQVGVDTMFFSTGPGCDSLIITTTTLDPSYIINLSASTCDSLLAGVDTMFLSTGPGCDSLIITTTTYAGFDLINLSASTCDPLLAGIDTAFFINQANCDSFVVTTTTLDPSYIINLSASSCDPANVGVDTMFFSTGPGCDSLIITTTTLDPSYIVNLSASSCDPANVGVDTMFFSTGPGCDSLIITTTTLDPSYIINLSASSCDPANVGVDTMFFSTGPGCDSLIITTTTLDPSYIINLSASSCDPANVGVDTLFLTTGPGCDSLIITTTTLDPSYIINLSASSCDPAEVGVDTMFLSTGPGCDSLIITTTTLDPSYTFNVSASSCDPANVGVDTLFLTTGPGCDSLIITTTTLDPSYTFNVSASSCDPANVGVDTLFLTTGPGCDSLIITTTTLDPSYIINLSATTCDPANVGMDTLFLSTTGPGCDSLIITTTSYFPITTSIATTPETCAGANGTATVTAVGGTSPFSYAWSNGQITATATGLSAGSLTVVVTDAAGCTGGIDTVTVNYSCDPVCDLLVTGIASDISCNAANDGSIDLTILSSNPVNILWSTSATSEDISSLAAGNYTVTVTDSADVDCDTTIVFTINEPTVISLFLSPLNVTCFGDANGSVDLTVAGGTPPFSYQWSNTATTEDISSVGPGTYTVIVTDANGCTATDSAIVTEPTQLLANMSSTMITCNGGNDGTATVSPSGGNGGYVYQWDANAGNQITATAVGLTAGNYSVAIADSLGCNTIGMVTVGEPSVISLILDSVPNSCFGGSDGQASVVASGGTPGYTYNWSDGQTTAIAVGLSAASYTVTVTDHNSCSQTGMVVVTQPSMLIANCGVIDPVSCPNALDGSVFASAVGGTAPYSFDWYNSSFTFVGSGDTITNLGADVYTVIVTDANGCMDTCDLILQDPQALLLSQTHVDVDCYGYATGSIDLTISGGSAPFSYAWSNGDTTEDISNLAAGTYTVTVTDDRGCTEDLSVNISENPQLILAVQNTNVSCFGNTDGTAFISVFGGVPGYTYLWNTTPPQTSALALNLPPGPVDVTVTDAVGCDSTISIWILEPSQLNTTVSKTNVSCNGAADGSISITASGGTPYNSGAPYTYMWNTIPQQTTATATGLSAGNYTCIVSDSTWCIKFVVVTIVEPQQLNLNLSGNNVLCNGGTSGSATVVPTGGTPGFTYLWSNGASTSTITGLIAGAYTVTVTDMNNCTTTGSLTLTEPSPIVFNGVVTNVKCNGDSTGKILLNVVGGTPPYTYLWNTIPAQTLSIAQNLPAGTYAAIISDANGCTAVGNYNVTENDPIAITPTVINAVCNAESNGSISLAVTGGVAPYSYLWSNGNTTSSDTGLVAGTYNITVTDSLGCDETISIAIAQPGNITCSFLVTNVSCNGASTGLAAINVSGGTAPYSYLWSTGDTSNIASGLSAGIYTVTVTDSVGCVKVETVIVTEPSELTCVCNANVNNVSCFGANDGSITALPLGGTPPYSFLWSDGQVGSTAVNLAAGAYTVTITDANACIKVGVINVTEPSALTCSTSVINVTCQGGNDGVAAVFAGGGTPPYTYAWNTNPAQNTSTAIGLAAGTYTVTITDANGCTKLCSAVISQPATSLNCVTVINDASCSGASTGTAAVFPSGGNPPYTYSWNTNPPQTTQTIIGLSAGIYTVTVADAGGCTKNCTAVIDEPSKLVALYQASNPTCTGASDGTIDVTVTGGTSPYYYTWSNGATTEDLTGLPAGTYILSIIDAKGCNIIAWVILMDPAQLNCSVAITNATCHNGSNGSASAVAIGGTAPYNYLWSNGMTTANISGLMSSVYEVTITDASGCTTTCSGFVSAPSPVACSTYVVDSLTCYGDMNAKAGVNATGGTPPYSYSWSTNPVQTTPLATGLGAGVYTVVITDAQGCTSSCDVTIATPAQLQCTATCSHVNCNGGADGVIIASANGGSAPYSYAWSNGATTQVNAGLTAGVYTVYITDAEGCTVSCTHIVNEPPALGLLKQYTDVLCNGDSTGTASAIVNGGTPPYSYQWSNGETTNNISGLAAGTYIVTVTDSNSCVIIGVFSISEPPAIVCATSTTPAVCNGSSSGTATVTTAGGTQPFQFEWNTIPPQFSITATGLSAGTYSVTITDANGCTQTCSATVSQAPALSCTTDVLKELDCYGDTTAKAIVNVTGGTPPYTYFWSTLPAQTTQLAVSLGAGTYSVIVTDAQGCTSICFVTVVSPPELTCNVPNSVISCSGGSGKLTVTANGGTAPYTYLWNTTPPQTSAMAIGLLPGNYVVTVTDSVGCVTTCSGNVSSSSNIICTSDSGNVSCHGGSDGFASVSSVSGGTPPYTYSWNTNPPQTTPVATGLSAGSYTVTITDSLGCQIFKTFIISEPQPFVITVNGIVNVACNGDSTGSATANPTNGNAPFSYMWSNGQSNKTALYLGAGLYTVTVTDANGCTATGTAIINEPVPLVCDSAFGSVTCFGDSNGSATIYPSGGVQPYTYSWSTNPPQTTQSATGLSAGFYYVIITDAAGCSKTACVKVTEPAQMICGLSAMNPLCNGSSDGSATANVVGGTPPYTYVWNTVPFQTTATATGLSAGFYTLTATDANNCTTQCTIQINDPQLLLCTPVSTPVDCHGDSTGTLSAINVLGGSPPYAYLWSNGSTSAIVTGVPAGIYTVTVTDANGCSTMNVTVVTEPSPLTCFANGSTATCGLNNGSVSATANGGTAPYNYLWNTVPASTASSVNNVPAGTYTVTITDDNGCTTTCSATVTGAQLLSATVLKWDVSCNGLSDGSATINVSNGTAPYSYVWNTAPVQITQTATGLSVGSYQVTVTDAAGCTLQQQVLITEPMPLICTTNSSASQCGLNNGSASVTPSGGTGPYNYLWSNNATTPTINNLTAGMYTVTITDANNCTTSCSEEVLAVGVLSCIPTHTNVTCFGASDGTATIGQITGGTPPYSYSWNTNPVQTTNMAVNLPAGTYTAVISDAFGCTKTIMVTVTEPAAFSCNASVVIEPDCNDMGGVANATATGGTASYSYSWNTNPVQTMQTATGLSGGTYIVTVTDANNCTSTCSVTLTTPGGHQIALSSAIYAGGNNIRCNGGSDGYIDLTVSGAPGPFTYQWSSGQTTEDLMMVPAGTYIVTVSYQGCDVIDSITLIEPDPLTFNAASIVNNLCNGDSIATVTANVNGGSAPYNYSWNTVPAQTTQTATGLSAGTYILMISDANGCVKHDTIVLVDPPALAFGTPSIMNATCSDGTDGSATINMSGGTPPYTYMWANGQTTQTATGLAMGTYVVTITDDNGCTYLDTASVIVNSPEPIVLSLTDSFEICSVDSDLSPYQHGEFFYDQWTGITVTGTSNISGVDTVIIFDSDTTGTLDPDLEVNLGPILIIPQNIADLNGDSLVDAPDDNAFGGTMRFEFDECVTVNSFKFIDQDVNNLPVVTAYDSLGAIIAQVSVPNMGEGSVQTVALNAACVSVLEIVSPTSFAVTDFDLDCGRVQGGCVNGSVDLTASGGTPAYMYLWSNGATTEDLNGVACDTYTVTVTDANGCTMTRSITITPNTAPIQCNIQGTNATACGFANNGSATIVSVTGGAAPYTYQWSTIPTQTSATATGLAPGTYYTVVTDFNGCTTVEAITIGTTSSIAVAATTSNVNCWGGSDGAFMPIPSGGQSPYTYLWSDGKTDASRADLTRGTWSVTVTDANGCTKAIARWINSPTPLLGGTISHSAATCSGANDGTFVPWVSGGTAPYTYMWTDGGTAASRTDLGRGVWSVTITDANGCSKTIIRWINSPTELRVNSGFISQASCWGSNDGVFNPNVFGGTAPYTYLWSDGATTATRNDLSRGVWGVTVTDANGCTKQINRWINSPSDLTVVAGNLAPASCDGASDGSFHAWVWGGTAPYTYLWSDGSTVQHRNDLSRGTWSVTVTDASGCSKTIARWINSPPGIYLACTATGPSTSGGNDGSASAIVANGTAPYSFLWNDGQVTQTATGLVQGIYSVIVTDANGCTQTDFVNVTDGQSSRGVESDGSEWTVKAYPNPTLGEINVELDADVSDRYLIKLIDLTGRELMVREESILQGVNTINYDFRGLEDGVYLLHVMKSNDSRILRIVIQ